MRILIVEDDTDIREYLKSRLQEKCFAIDIASDGPTALYQATINDYDLILLDYSLPGKNGYAVCAELRTSNVFTPIIMISATSEVPHKVDGFACGIDDYVTKPFFFEELLARIHAVLRRPRQQTQPILRIDDLTLDTVKQKVCRANENIYLTRKEFSLLEYLMQNSGNVISRGTLMEHIWDVNVDPFSNTIETHILNLRKKIDRPSRRKLIHNVPGRGYKIEYIH